MIVQHAQHCGHAAAHGAHHFGHAAGSVRAIAHLDDVDLVDAGKLGGEGVRHFRHLVDHHVDDGGLVEVLPGFGLFLKSLGFGEELALDDFGLGLTNRQHLRRFGAADALDLGRLAGALGTRVPSRLPRRG